MISLKNLSVRGKILLVVVVGLAFQATLALAGLYYLDAARRSLDTAVGVEAASIRQIAVLRPYFLDMIIDEKNMIISDTEEERTRYRSAFDVQQREVRELVVKLQEIVGARGTDHIDAFMNEYREYLAIHQRIRDLIAKNDKAGAMQLSAGPARDYTVKAREELQSLIDDSNAALDQRKQDSDASSRAAIMIMIGTLLATLLVGFAFGLVVTRAITSSLGSMVSVADAIAGGNLDNAIDVSGRDEVARLALSVDKMQAALRSARSKSEAQDWLKTGLTRLSDVMRGELAPADIAGKVISEVSAYLDAKVGVFYMMSEEGGQQALSLLGSYAYTRRKNLSNRFGLGEGLVGQAALERKQILVSNVPDDYIKVTSGLGEAVPRHICVTPLAFHDRVKGAIEVATLGPLTDHQLEYLSQAMPAVAITLETAQGRERLRVALEESQRLTEELQVQQEELKSANEELEEQAQRLKQSEEKLKAQQEELQVTNEELEEKNQVLERQKKEVEHARKDLEEQAEELALASKYKSEFLANMSHELRTPLNSLLLLARGFSENKEGNLTNDQLESARMIHQSGSDLLSLMNEILDLSKIEAGRMELQLDEVMVSDLADSMRTSFQHLALEKGLSFEASVLKGAPERITTDRRRLKQVIRNLLSNALKFTEQGGVTVTFGMPALDADLRRSGLSHEPTVAIAVQDTGIGIAADRHKVIFEAFQQADGGISRKYGGTGLGLSICRELVKLLGGEIQLQSEPGKGSTFTVFLPIEGPKNVGEASHTTAGSVLAAARAEAAVETVAKGLPAPVPDDRGVIKDGDHVILIIEDDAGFAGLLVKQCRERGLKCLAAASGEDGIELARHHRPKGIILDIKLPGIDGWRVLEDLKENPATRHIPVHIISVEEPSTAALRKGAIGHLRKPVTREDIDEALKKLEDVAANRVKTVLVVEDDNDMRRSIVELIADDQVRVDEAAGAQQALDALRSKRYDCMILDLGLWDMNGGQLLKRAEQEGGVEIPPVIVYTARDLTHDEEMELRAYSDSIIVKDVRSQERLFDEVSLFLHRAVAEMPERKRQIITNLHESDTLLRGKKVLVVDDDMRTVFALSKLLSDYGMMALKAENGEKALKLLAEQPDMDVVLMDIMMPVLDGLETMRRLRAQERFAKLPIIALTAKAMKGDCEQCMANGASDYLPKPVDQDQLLSMMRVWLYR